MTLFTHRLAQATDIPAIRALMDAAIGELQRAVLTAEQIAASRVLMGLDTQLIADETYCVVETGGTLAGCGGWSRRATLYGGDHSPGREPALLNPAGDSARVRAMYTAPAFARRGVGRLILGLCEAAAAPKASAASNWPRRSRASRFISPADTVRSNGSPTHAAGSPCRSSG